MILTEITQTQKHRSLMFSWRILDLPFRYKCSLHPTFSKFLLATVLAQKITIKHITGLRVPVPKAASTPKGLRSLWKRKREDCESQTTRKFAARLSSSTIRCHANEV